MEYFIPAWHEDNSDWAVAIPSITILDATSHMRILQNNGHQVGIIISTYEPGLMTRLNQLNYYPDQLFSIYDYLQGIHNLESRVVEINDFAWPKNAIFMINPRQPYQEELSNLNQGNLLVSKTDLADKLEQQYPEKFSVNVIPAYNSEFRLGHSSRERVQRIAFFAENANQADIEKIIKHLCKYVSHDFKNKSIQVFTYSLDKDNWVNQVIDKIKKDSKGKWIISSGDEKEKVENIEIAGLGKAKGLPQIKIKELRLTNISQLLKALDKTRVLISWGSVDVVTPEIRTRISGVLLCLN
ncbi:accessory Sec system glycosyltransferase Asp1 [Lactobacillus gasseri]|nr:accessory Sec system glycosyltransferase Asp1 [Lactobacillus gasseri]